MQLNLVNSPTNQLEKILAASEDKDLHRRYAPRALSEQMSVCLPMRFLSEEATD